ncbi:MAG: hypothetical protein PHW04_04585 [Candidatus Wallbacteria bacterium]|nr:hypothetical protein [Candidatus Wallbacteria bacterium]
MNRRGMSLVEMMMAVLLCGFFFAALYRLQASMNRTTEFVRWKTQSQDTIRRFYKDYLIPDINKATYPSTIDADMTTVPDPTNAMKLQYLKGGAIDPNDPNTSIIKFDSLSDGQILMKWQISHPGVTVDLAQDQGQNDSDPSFAAVCEIVAYKRSPYDTKRRNVIVYRRTTTDSTIIKPVNDKVMVENVEYIKMSHSPRYKPAEIIAMNVLPNSITPNNPMGVPMDPSDPDYFHTWNNSGSINIEIGLIQDVRVTVLLTGGPHRFTTQEKVSIKTNVEIIPTAGFN